MITVLGGTFSKTTRQTIPQSYSHTLPGQARGLPLARPQVDHDHRRTVWSPGLRGHWPRSWRAGQGIQPDKAEVLWVCS